MRSDLKILVFFTLKTSKNNQIRYFLRNGRVRVKNMSINIRLYCFQSQRSQRSGVPTFFSSRSIRSGSHSARSAVQIGFGEDLTVVKFPYACKFISFEPLKDILPSYDSATKYDPPCYADLALPSYATFSLYTPVR